jgi:hypothetical protein
VLEPLTGGGGGAPLEEDTPAVFRKEDATVDRTAAKVTAAVAEAAGCRGEALLAAPAASLERTEGTGRVVTLTEDVRGLVFGLAPVTLTWEPVQNGTKCEGKYAEIWLVMI